MHICLFFIFLATTSMYTMQREYEVQKFLEKDALENTSFKELLCTYVPIELKVLQDNRHDQLKPNEHFFVMKFSTDEKIMAATRGEKIFIVDCNKEQWQRTVSHIEQVCAICFRPDNQVLASATRNNSITFWNCDRETFWKCDKVGKNIESCKDLIEICFSADGKLIFGLQREGKIYAWHCDDGSRAFIVCGYPDMYTIRRSTDGQYIEGLTSDVCFVWNMQGDPIENKTEKNIEKNISKITHIKLHNDAGISLILENPTDYGIQCGYDTTLRVCTEREYGIAKQVAMSDSGNKLAVIGTRGILLWDLTLFNAIFKLKSEQQETITTQVKQRYEAFKKSLVENMINSMPGLLR